MRFQSLISPIAFALTAVVLLYCQSITGETDSVAARPLKTTVTSYKAVPLTTQETSFPQAGKKATDEPLKPFRLSSRFHLKKGTDEGYLIVKFELPKESYIYSLTQPNPFPKTKITVVPSSYFSLTGKKAFAPDKLPKIIERDPDFGARLEKHFGVVQFVVPMKMNKTITAKELEIKIDIDGQVCDETTCLPISRKRTTARFAGFFDPSDKKSGIPLKTTLKKK